MKAKFVCVSKSGESSFTVNLEPAVNKDRCEKCGKPYMVRSEGGAMQEERVGDRHIFCQDDGGRFIPGDRTFFQDTPHAAIFMSVLTPEAGALFELGKEVTIDFGTDP